MVKPIAAASARRRRQSRPTSAPRCGARPREWLQHGAVPAHPDLLTDLTGLEYGYTIREGRDALILERKEDMKKRGLASPDLADALALTFAYSVVASDHTRRMSTRSPHQIEYDPYAAMYRSGSRASNHQVDYNPLAEQLRGPPDPRYRQR